MCVRQPQSYEARHSGKPRINLDHAHEYFFLNFPPSKCSHCGQNRTSNLELGSAIPKPLGYHSWCKGKKQELAEMKELKTTSCANAAHTKVNQLHDNVGYNITRTFQTSEDRTAKTEGITETATLVQINYTSVKLYAYDRDFQN